MISLKYIYTFTVSILLVIWVSACSETPKNYVKVIDASPYARAESIESLLRDHNIGGQNVGYILQDLKTGKVLSSKNADVAFIPASTAKLFTGYAALEVLGDDFRFQTRLCAHEGDLYLVGGGDPSLQVEDLMAMSYAFSSKGNMFDVLYYDDSLYPDIEYVENTQPHDAYYNPPVSALSTKDALTLINWQAGAEDGTVELFESPSLSPALADVPTDWLLDVKAGSQGQARFPLVDPALHSATLFHLFAARTGTDLPKPVGRQVPAGGCDDPMVVHESSPMKMIVGQLFESSSNVQAELIGLAIANALGDAPSSLGQSAEILSNWYKGKFPDTNWDDFMLANHSGLSVETRIAPSHMAPLLAAGEAKLVPLMPISGWKGWLKGRLKTPDVSMRVWAKTGAVNYGIGLSGYLYSKSESPLAFSIFVNDVEKRAAYDLMDEDEQLAIGATASQWNRMAKNTIDEIVRFWANSY